MLLTDKCRQMLIAALLDRVLACNPNLIMYSVIPIPSVSAPIGPFSSSQLPRIKPVPGIVCKCRRKLKGDIKHIFTDLY